MTKRFTGKHMFAILVGFFGTVMAVNFTMASFATSTFGGIQVENSYVASQKFNGWLAKAEAQEALGWEVITSRDNGGRLLVSAKGPGQGAILTASARQPLGNHPDQQLTFERNAQGQFISAEALPTARWIVRLQIVDGADEWRREDTL